MVTHGLPHALLMVVRYTHHGSLEAVSGVGRTIPLGISHETI